MSKEPKEIKVKCWKCLTHFNVTIEAGGDLDKATVTVYKGGDDTPLPLNQQKVEKIREQCPRCGRLNMIDVAWREQ